MDVLDRVLTTAAGGFIYCEDTNLPPYPLTCNHLRSVCKLWVSSMDSAFENWALRMIELLQGSGRLHWQQIMKQPPDAAKERFVFFVWEHVTAMQSKYISAFHCACTFGLSNVVRFLFRERSFEAGDLETGYRLAAENCKFDTIRLFYHPDILFSKGFNVLRADVAAALLQNYGFDHASLQSIYDNAGVEDNPTVVLMVAAAYGDVETVVEVVRAMPTRHLDMYYKCALKWATRRLDRRMLDALVDKFF